MRKPLAQQGCGRRGCPPPCCVPFSYSMESFTPHTGHGYLARSPKVQVPAVSPSSSCGELSLGREMEKASPTECVHGTGPKTQDSKWRVASQSPSPSSEEADIPQDDDNSSSQATQPVTSVWTKVLDGGVTYPAVNPRLHPQNSS